VSDWTTYDETRYSNHPYVQTHPDRLAVIATLHGMKPPAPSRARVLEIGCGAGANLLALAYASPEVNAVGIDLAHTAIEEARTAATEVGIPNAEFQHADVMDIVDGRLGEFDYVISHGVYAWIPPAAREALLAAVKAHLAPDGIAYVSYNAHPGGHLRRLLREAALWHSRDATPGPEQAEKARELFQFLEIRVAEDPYGGMLGMEVPVLAASPQHRLVHDELSDFWAPVWFSDFARAAAGHGLAYLAEASPLELWPPTYPDGVQEKLAEISGGDRVAREQYQDLLLFRRFRSTMLCHEGVEVADALVPDTLRTLLFTARAPDEDLPEGLRRRAQILLSGARPRALPFEELRAGLGDDVEPEALLEAIMDAMREFGIGPRVDPPARGLVAGERPRASALARWQIARQPEVTTLLHAVVRIDDQAGQTLLGLLDGTRDREQIRRDLAAAGGPELAVEQLDVNLRSLGELGLLHD